MSAADAPPSPTATRGLPEDAYVIAADSGLDHALALGLAVDLVVGDLDSISHEGLSLAQAQGIEIDQHPQAKDQSDLELALDRALARGPARVVVIGGAGGRIDHLLTGLLVLATNRYAPLAIEARLGSTLVTVIRHQADLQGAPGDLVTLVPVGGAAAGITTEGLEYPLLSESLQPGTTRGVSNVMVAAVARVRVTAGVLLAVQPGAVPPSVRGRDG